MALVAYDYGSDSEEGEDEEIRQNNSSTKIETPIVNGSEMIVNNNDANKNTSESIKNNTVDPSMSSEISDEEDTIAVSSSNTISNMFEKLPHKKETLDRIKTDFEDVVEDFIPKAKVQNKQKGKIKITVPSLSEFDDEEDEEPVLKKYKQSIKGSGLLSLLPPVKCVPLSNKSFIPNVLTQKRKTTESTKKPSRPLIPNSVIKKKEEVHSKSKETDSDCSDIEMPETYDDELWQKVCGKKVVKNIIVEQPIVDTVEEPIINLAPEPVAPYQGLDNAAFKELIGKNKRMPRNIKLIDVNEDELVAEKDLWMTKSLTDPEYIPKPSEDDDSLDPTKRKKHHITYLAQKAKANEQELQSQWSASKHNRMQSRAKYGF